MSDAARQWDDLQTRLITAAVLIAVGGLAIWAGGLTLRALVALVAGAMIWELVRMLSPQQILAGRALPFLALVAVFLVDSDYPFWVAISIPLILGMIWLKQHRVTYLLYGFVVLVGPASLYVVREYSGLSVVLLIVLVVIVTDVAGYFVGRTVGGPKFWPRVSPKKTWSGTVGGWICAALVGVFWISGEFGPWIIAVCIALSLASQMGDIAESAIKRMVGVKDCSELLPGHGGFLDRFDGMIAAFTGWALIALLTGTMPGPL